eukprot:scaffold295169_cov18-Tisochrysis_lutea.AAC.1
MGEKTEDKVPLQDLTSDLNRRLQIRRAHILGECASISIVTLRPQAGTGHPELSMAQQSGLEAASELGMGGRAMTDVSCIESVRTKGKGHIA